MYTVNNTYSLKHCNHFFLTFSFSLYVYRSMKNCQLKRMDNTDGDNQFTSLESVSSLSDWSMTKTVPKYTISHSKLSLSHICTIHLFTYPPKDLRAIRSPKDLIKCNNDAIVLNTKCLIVVYKTRWHFSSSPLLPGTCQFSIKALFRYPIKIIHRQSIIVMHYKIANFACLQLTISHKDWIKQTASQQPSRQIVINETGEIRFLNLVNGI